ncbi:hypothetical protein PAEAM_41890 [Paenibacillus sp. GM1FR]|nr:hypothetical protein PAEAM_41890 [Paenibacillus sp. GM1FR]
MIGSSSFNPIMLTIPESFHTERLTIRAPYIKWIFHSMSSRKNKTLSD